MGRFASVIFLSLVGSARTISDRDEVVRMDVDTTTGYVLQTAGYAELKALAQYAQIVATQNDLMADYDRSTAHHTTAEEQITGVDAATAEQEKDEALEIHKEAVQKVLALREKEEEMERKLAQAQQAAAAVLKADSEISATSTKVDELSASIPSAKTSIAAAEQKLLADTAAASAAVTSALELSASSKAAEANARQFYEQCVADEEATVAANAAAGARNASAIEELEARLEAELAALTERKESVELEKQAAQEKQTATGLLYELLANDLRNARAKVQEAQLRYEKAEQKKLSSDKWHDAVFKYYESITALEHAFETNKNWAILKKEGEVTLGSKGLPDKADKILDAKKALKLGKEIFDGMRTANYYKVGLIETLTSMGNEQLIGDVNKLSKQLEEHAHPEVRPFCKFWKLQGGATTAGEESCEEYRKSLLKGLFKSKAHLVKNLVKTGMLSKALRK